MSLLAAHDVHAGQAAPVVGLDATTYGDLGPAPSGPATAPGKSSHDPVLRWNSGPPVPGRQRRADRRQLRGLSVLRVWANHGPGDVMPHAAAPRPQAANRRPPRPRSRSLPSRQRQLGVAVTGGHTNRPRIRVAEWLVLPGIAISPVHLIGFRGPLEQIATSIALAVAVQRRSARAPWIGRNSSSTDFCPRWISLCINGVGASIEPSC